MLGIEQERLFTGEHYTVTPTRVIGSNVSLAVNQITGIHPTQTPNGMGCISGGLAFMAFSAFGVVLAILLGVPVMGPDASDGERLSLAVGEILLGSLLLWGWLKVRNRPRITHTIALTLSDGTQRCLTTEDPNIAQGLVQAIEAALDRGGKPSASGLSEMGSGDRRFCEACGTSLNKEARFCGSCGTAVRA